MRDGELLAATPLFQGSTVEEIEGMLGCLGMRERASSTGERIHRMGDRIREVGPSTFFRAYRTVKEQEAKGKPRSEIVGMLMERFGEQNPDVGVQ